ncbi:DUF3501 family protein [Sulfuracidifex metallicus]|uniref:DUF3501 family protein n=1 Tax=Sulfuracidifex metallicus DSM 6482 = JCM 9184 TaxID=523847 RepID=A0A6A9QKD4_SULME|nr:DUF3501 family protein [Sulfuracidifex metallicus]MUN29697.1 DUF3501 family protein [Sulfuracidifex metallicus DSM 6482 = JCM 9184]WOE49795.1 DUF3501 family protein [Sulfuracidifex metallicus DSM 6482 = JCM 9184]
MIKSEEVLPWNEYEKIRKDRIAKIVELKKERRIELGDRMSILFENKDTVLHQIQEMVYLDRLSSEKDREHEIEVYKNWLPCGGKVKATLYIYAKDNSDLLEVFRTLPKIYDSIFLKVGSKLIQGEPENGYDQGEAFSTLQPLTFDLAGERSFDMEINVVHENYKFKMKIPESLARKIIEEAYEEC